MDPPALEIRETVHDLVRGTEAILRPPEDIDPDEIDQTFTLRCGTTIASFPTDITRSSVSRAEVFRYPLGNKLGPGHEKQSAGRQIAS